KAATNDGCVTLASVTNAGPASAWQYGSPAEERVNISAFAGTARFGRGEASTVRPARTSLGRIRPRRARPFGGRSSWGSSGRVRFGERARGPARAPQAVRRDLALDGLDHRAAEAHSIQHFSAAEAAGAERIHLHQLAIRDVEAHEEGPVVDELRAHRGDDRELLLGELAGVDVAARVEIAPEIVGGPDAVHGAHESSAGEGLTVE